MFRKTMAVGPLELVASWVTGWATDASCLAGMARIVVVAIELRKLFVRHAAGCRRLMVVGLFGDHGGYLGM